MHISVHADYNSHHSIHLNADSQILRTTHRNMQQNIFELKQISKAKIITV